MFDKLLVCLDGSEPARKALQAGLELADRFGGEVLCLSVFDPAPLHAVGAMTPGAVISTGEINRQSDEWHAFVEGTVAPVWQEARAPVRVLREYGSPMEKIVQVAKQENVGMILIGSRGIGGFQRLLLGSVSEGVAHHAPCPIMVMR